MSKTSESNAVHTCPVLSVKIAYNRNDFFCLSCIISLTENWTFASTEICFNSSITVVSEGSYVLGWFLTAYPSVPVWVFSAGICHSTHSKLQPCWKKNLSEFPTLYLFVCPSLNPKYCSAHSTHSVSRHWPLQNIPGFWMTVFWNHPQLSAMIRGQDAEMLRYVTTLKVKEWRHPKTGCKFKPLFDH